jgi:hypothetical protein
VADVWKEVYTAERKGWPAPNGRLNCMPGPLPPPYRSLCHQKRSGASGFALSPSCFTHPNNWRPAWIITAGESIRRAESLRISCIITAAIAGSANDGLIAFQCISSRSQSGGKLSRLFDPPPVNGLKKREDRPIAHLGACSDHKTFFQPLAAPSGYTDNVHPEIHLQSRRVLQGCSKRNFRSLCRQHRPVPR